MLATSMARATFTGGPAGKRLKPGSPPSASPGRQDRGQPGFRREDHVGGSLPRDPSEKTHLPSCLLGAGGYRRGVTHALGTTDAPLEGASPGPAGSPPQPDAGDSPVPPLAALTSNARPEVASIALYQAIQVGKPGYLQIGTNIVPNIIHCSGNARPTGHRQGARDRAQLPSSAPKPGAGGGDHGESPSRRDLASPSESCQKRGAPGLLHLTHQPLLSFRRPT